MFFVRFTLFGLHILLKIEFNLNSIYFQPGEKVMILPTVDDEEADKAFDKKIDRVGMPSKKNYVRTTTNYEAK